jgi:flagellar basal body rod protein FlgB
MLTRLMGSESAVARLREGLDASTVRARGIAHRIANASTPGATFEGALDAAAAQDGATVAEGGVNLEAEMVALADEQIRFEAVSRLLQKVYAQVRSSVKERG